MMAQNVPETKKESDEISPWTGNDLVDQLEMKWAMSVLGNPIWTRAGRLLPPPQECQAEERGTPSHGNTKRQRNLIQIRNRKLEVWRKWVRPPTFQWVGASGHRSTSIIRSQKWYLTRENQSWKWVSWKKKKNHKTLANLLFVLPIKDCDHHRDHRCPTSDRQQTSKKARRGMKLLWFPALHLLTHLPPTQSPPCPPCHHPPPLLLTCFLHCDPMKLIRPILDGLSHRWELFSRMLPAPLWRYIISAGWVGISHWVEIVVSLWWKVYFLPHITTSIYSEALQQCGLIKSLRLFSWCSSTWWDQTRVNMTSC